jgi:hypothetical protein
LGWNIISYLLSGQRAKLSVSSISVLNAGSGTPQQPAIQITVSATGKVPIEVTGWSLSFPDEFHIHSDLVRLQYGHLEGIHLGDEIPKVIQPGGRGIFLLPRVVVDAGVRNYNFDLTKGRIHVFFAARKPLHDTQSIARRLGRAASGTESPPREQNGA